MKNDQKKIIESRIESVELDIFFLEMKDHLTSDDSMELSRLYAKKDELTNQLKAVS